MSEEAAAAKSKSPSKRPNLVLILVPVAVIAALVLLFSLPPTHAMIVNGPLKPVLAKIGLAPAATGKEKPAKPVDLAAEVKRMADELEAARKTETAKDARIADLQAQVDKAQQPEAANAAPVVSPTPAAVPADVKRVAAYWAGMEPEKAADIAARLPDTYVKAVFGQMPADAVAEIANALPAKTAAKLMATADAPLP